MKFNREETLVRLKENRETAIEEAIVLHAIAHENHAQHMNKLLKSEEADLEKYKVESKAARDQGIKRKTDQLKSLRANTKRANSPLKEPTSKELREVRTLQSIANYDQAIALLELCSDEKITLPANFWWITSLLSGAYNS